MLRDRAQAERVIKEEQELENSTQKEIQHRPVTPSPTFQVKDTNNAALANSALPQITQDKYKSPQLANIHQQRPRTLTQDFTLQCMEILCFKALFTPRQAAARQYPLQFLCDLAYSVLDDKTGDLLKYCHLMKHPKYKDLWAKSFCTEIRCLATTTETIFFMKKDEIPQERKGGKTYARTVCVYCNGKKDKYRTRIMMGSNLVNYPGDCRTPSADLITVKLLLNSIISTHHSKFMTLDHKDFYLMAPMKCYKYFSMTIELFPQDIINKYDLKDKVDHNGNAHCKVRCGMYGLRQAGIIAQELLQECLLAAKYSQSKLTPGYWKHEWLPISFTLVVDDLGIKYIGNEHAMHLIKTLKEHYKVEEYWEGKQDV